MFCVKGEVFTFSDNPYSPATIAWKVIADMHDRHVYFCGCSFIDNVFVLGRLLQKITYSCIELYTKEKHTWKENGIIKEA